MFLLLMHRVDIWAPFSGSKEKHGKWNTRDTHVTRRQMRHLEYLSLAPLLKGLKHTLPNNIQNMSLIL